MPHSTTGVSLSELMYGRRVRSHFDLIHPDLGGRVRKNQDCQKQGHDRRSRAREFNVGDAKNYGPGPAWLPGQAVEVSGAVLYTIMLEDGRSVRRHVEQLRSRTNTGQKRAREIFDSQ